MNFPHIAVQKDFWIFNGKRVIQILCFQSEFQALLPKVLVAIKAMLSQEEDQAAESMELFDVLAECEVRKG